MRWIAVYARSSTVREILTLALERAGGFEMEECGSRPPEGPPHLERAEVLVVCRDLSPVDRLRILGRAWSRAEHPRILFLEFGVDGQRFTDEDGDRTVRAIQDLLSNGSRTARVRLPAQERRPRSKEPPDDGSPERVYW